MLEVYVEKYLEATSAEIKMKYAKAIKSFIESQIFDLEQELYNIYPEDNE